jgi:integrase
MASIRKRTWVNKKGEQTAWVVAYMHKGKQHIKTFATKRAATDWRAEMQQEKKRGTHTPASQSPTIAEAGASWLKQAETDGLEASTVMQYRQHLELHIVPFIGATTLAEFSVEGAQDFKNQLIAAGRSPVMAKKVTSSLGAIVGHAMAMGKVGRNVVKELALTSKRQRRLEKRHKKKLEVGVDIPTKDEIRAILGAATGRWRPIVVTAIFTGLRASELRGLRWDDVELAVGTLTVRQRADRFRKIGAPKSKDGQREIPLAPIVVNTLREWRLACPRGEANLVFPNQDGNVLPHTVIHRRGMGPLQVAAGISTDPLKPKYGLHSLRHACASLWIEDARFSPKRIQALIGHSTIQMTFDTYGHLFPSQDTDQDAMAQLQARLVG